ncbi:hypothetical protein [Bosea massiliensis]|uniref:Uncharacterized protein n=1 Tax=Bosea massiliensis TaxID=151419 RepID=A0ABW0NXV5_9HYPH
MRPVNYTMTPPNETLSTDPSAPFSAAGFVVQRPAGAGDVPSFLARSDLGWCWTWSPTEAEVFATEVLAAAQLDGPAYGEDATIVEVSP